MGISVLHNDQSQRTIQNLLDKSKTNDKHVLSNVSDSSRKLQVRKVTSNYERRFTGSSIDSTKMMKYLHIGGWKFQEVKVQSNVSHGVKSTPGSPDMIDRSVKITEGESYDIIDDKLPKNY